MKHQFQIHNFEDFIRLDQFLLTKLSNYSRSFLQNLIKKGHCLVNQQMVKTGYILKLNDVVDLVIPENKPLLIEAVDLKLDIIYEDDDLLVINKPKGLVVHPASSYKDATLVHGLLHQVNDLSGINGVLRPGIVHRLDKDTSGLLLVAKHDKCHQLLSDAFKNHEVKRSYLALCYHPFEEAKATIHAPIGRHPKNRLKMAVNLSGKDAITHVKVLKNFREFAYVECDLETGRTHQIRVHLSYINHPIVGDPLYGPKHVIGSSGQFLHAYKIDFIHPIKKRQMTFTVDLPDDFKEQLKRLMV